MQLRMKTNKQQQSYLLKFLNAVLALALIVGVSGCDDDPKKEDTPELITKAVLTFTPASGGFPVVVTATDPDGAGVNEITVDGSISLAVSTNYTLTIQLFNELASASEPEYDITTEIREEDHEHMFFFSWTNNVFSNPAGNGNIDSRGDDVNYDDEDDNSLPVGLKTLWTTAGASSGKFRVVLKHQPEEQKTATSTSTDGETDLDLEFDISVQ